MTRDKTSYSVLVVDDDPEMTDMLVTVLADAGYGVAAASSGPAALSAVRAHPPDLVVTDLSMPEMDGLDLVESVRADRPGTHFILLTAFGDWPSYCRAQDLEVEGYLSKPVSMELLLADVARILDPSAEET